MDSSPLTAKEVFKLKLVDTVRAAVKDELRSAIDPLKDDIGELRGDVTELRHSWFGNGKVGAKTELDRLKNHAKIATWLAATIGVAVTGTTATLVVAKLSAIL